MKVRIWPAGKENDGTSQYRLLMPAQVLHDEGADIVIDYRGPLVKRVTRGWFPQEDDPIQGLAEVPDADVIVMQRPGRRWWADVIPFLQKEGIKVVVDVDDLFSDIDKANKAHRDFSPVWHENMNYEWVARACQRANTVTCTTPLLQKRYGFGHGVVLPNLVPERYLNVEAVRMYDTLGWTGTIDTHRLDLMAAQGYVQPVLDETAWTFHVVGTGMGVQKALGLAAEPTAAGWVPFMEYPEAMGAITVGMVPLADTKFNHAKSCLKMMEFAALGVPVLATATPDNERMRRLGVGATVRRPSEWEEALRKMLTDETYRDELAAKSRAAMADHTYERHAWRWARPWGLEK